MKEKVKVSREVAQALDFVKFHFDFEYIMKKQIDEKWLREDLLCLNRLSVERIARLLIAGYEIEETPEEKILFEYNRLKDLLEKTENESMKESCKSSMFSIEFTLNQLKKYIKGINE